MKRLILIFCGFLVFTCTKQKEQGLNGVWQYVSGEYTFNDSTTTFTSDDVNSMKIYSDTYYSMNTQNKTTEEYFAHSGSYALNGDEYTEVFKISKNPEMIGQSETFKYQINGNQLKISSDWLKEVWKKIE